MEPEWRWDSYHFVMDSNSMLTHNPIKFLSSFPNEEKEAPSYFWFADFNTD